MIDRRTDIAGDKIIWAVPLLEWQSLQVAAIWTPPSEAFPCTLDLKTSTGLSMELRAFLQGRHSHGIAAGGWKIQWIGFG